MLLTYVPRSCVSISLTSAKTSKPDSSATQVLPPTAFDKLYWARIVLAMAGGVLADTAQALIGTDFFTGISIGIGVYLASYYVARFTWYRRADQSAQAKVYSTGWGGFIMVFLFTWMLLFTLRSVGFSA